MKKTKKKGKRTDRGIEVHWWYVHSVHCKVYIYLCMRKTRRYFYKMQNGRHMSKSRSGKDLLQKNNYNKRNYIHIPKQRWSRKYNLLLDFYIQLVFFFVLHFFFIYKNVESWYVKCIWLVLKKRNRTNIVFYWCKRILCLSITSGRTELYPPL